MINLKKRRNAINFRVLRRPLLEPHDEAGRSTAASRCALLTHAERREGRTSGVHQSLRPQAGPLLSPDALIPSAL